MISSDHPYELIAVGYSWRELCQEVIYHPYRRWAVSQIAESANNRFCGDAGDKDR